MLAFWLENFAPGLYKGVGDEYEKVNKGFRAILSGVVALSVVWIQEGGREERGGGCSFEFATVGALA